jgi:hypothetical protein
VRKIIFEILKLVWKVFVQVFWKWIKPLLGKIIVVAVIVIALIGVIAVSAC